MSAAILENRRYKNTLLAVLILIISFCLLASINCEPALPLEVENQTDQGLTIYVQGVKVLEVTPGETAKGYSAPMIYTNYFVEGVNEHDEIIYSRIISCNKLQDDDWKIVITSSQQNPYFPLEIENETGHLLYISLDSTPIGSVEPGERMKKRPLPSDYDTYSIEAVSMIKADDVTKIVTVYSKVFTRSALEDLGWKIVIPPMGNSAESGNT